MASPLATGKQSVDLSGRVPGSRIRRDPAPARKTVVLRDRDEHNRRIVLVGVSAFALAIFIVLIGFSYAMSWSPSRYEIHLYL